MALSPEDKIFPGGARVWIDTDNHGSPTISFPVDEDGRIHPWPETPIEDRPQEDLPTDSDTA